MLRAVKTYGALAASCPRSPRRSPVPTNASTSPATVASTSYCSAEDLDSLEATLELLSSEAAMIRIRDAEAAVAAGDLTTAEEMAALMDERRQRELRDA